MFGVVESARGTGGVPRWYRRTSRARLVAEGQRETRPARFPHAPSRRRRPRGVPRGRGTVRPWSFLSPSMAVPACRTRWAARCATCGSRSPTAATSAARTACPRRSSARDYAFLPKRPGPDLRGDRARGPRVRRRSASRSSGSPAASRSSGATCRPHRDARRDPPAGRRRARPDPDDERLGAARARPAAGRRRPRRVTVSLDSLDDAVFGAMNGIDFPVERVLDGIAAAHRGGPRRRSRSTWSSGAASTSRASSRWPRWARDDRRHPAVHRVHGRRPLERLAARRGRPGPGAHRAIARRVAGRAGRPALPRRGRRSLALPRWRRRVRRHLVGDRSRSAATARAPGCRPRASSTRASSRSTATTLRAVLRERRRRTTSWSAFLARRLVAPRRSLLGAALGGDLDRCPGRDVRDGRLTRRPRPASSTGLSTGPRSRGHARPSSGEFVDNRVDRPPGRPVT